MITVHCTAFSKILWRVGYMWGGVGWVTPECRKIIWGPFERRQSKTSRRWLSKFWEGCCIACLPVCHRNQTKQQEYSLTMTRSIVITTVYDKSGVPVMLIRSPGTFFNFLLPFDHLSSSFFHVLFGFLVICVISTPISKALFRDGYHTFTTHYKTLNCATLHYCTWHTTLHYTTLHYTTHYTHTELEYVMQVHVHIITEKKIQWILAISDQKKPAVHNMNLFDDFLSPLLLITPIHCWLCDRSKALTGEEGSFGNCTKSPCMELTFSMILIQLNGSLLPLI